MRGDGSLPGRRDLLAGLGAIATGAVSGCSVLDGLSTETEPGTERTRGEGRARGDAEESGFGSDDLEIESRIDAVDAGADPTGQVPIDGVLHAHTDGTLLTFPDGRYRVRRVEIHGLSDVAWCAADGASPVFVPAQPADNVGKNWIGLYGIDGFVLEGIDYEFTDRGYGGRTFLKGAGDIAVRDLAVRGKFAVDGHQLCRIDVTDADGNAVVENLAATATSELDISTTGPYVGRDHAGTVVFRDCRLAEFSDNAIYASPPGGHNGEFPGADGKVVVEGGTFRNNNIAGVRLGSTESVVRNATVIVDDVPSHPHGLNVRGIRLRGQRDQLVDNCFISYTDSAAAGTGAIAIHGDNGRAFVRDTTIEMDRDEMAAVYAKPPEVDPPTGIVLENVTVTGTAADGSTIEIRERPGTEIRDCRITQTGQARDGVRFRRSDNCRIDNCQIRVTGEPIVAEKSSVRTERVATERLVSDSSRNSFSNQDREVTLPFSPPLPL